MAEHLRRCAELGRSVKATAAQHRRVPPALPARAAGGAPALPGMGLRPQLALSRKCAHHLARNCRSLFDPELRRLRATLRAECEAVLLEDYGLAQHHDVESVLWRAAFYRPIEEFRRRLRAAAGEMADKASGGGGGGAPRPQRREATRAAFCAFLEEGEAFYLVLVGKLQDKYGEAGYPQAVAAAGLTLPPPGEPQPPAAHDVRPSVVRCLICMGDLRRYHAGSSATPAAPGQPPQPRDWSRSRLYYTLATLASPQAGNAYNQLAVLATHEGDLLTAAFYYLRRGQGAICWAWTAAAQPALAAPTPFVLARENLSALLDQAKTTCEALDGANGKRVARPNRSKQQMHRELNARFVRLLGLLLTRTDLESFPHHLAEGLADLDDYLVRLRQQGKRLAASSAAPAAPPPLPLQLAALACYAAHAAAAPAAPPAAAAAGGAVGGAAGAPPPPDFAGAVQRQLVGTYALQLLLEVGQRLAAAATAVLSSGGKQAQASAVGPLLLLPPLGALLGWMAAVAAGSTPAPPSLLLSPAGQPEAGELGAARQRWWGAASLLLPTLARWAEEAVAQAGPPGASDAEAAATPLGEDWQLHGFAPLAPVQAPLDYASSFDGSSGEVFVVDPTTAAAVRGRRMLAALHALAARLAAVSGAAGAAAAPRAVAAAAALALANGGGQPPAEQLRLAVHAFLTAAAANPPLPPRPLGPRRAAPAARQERPAPPVTQAQPSPQQGDAAVAAAPHLRQQRRQQQPQLQLHGEQGPAASAQQAQPPQLQQQQHLGAAEDQLVAAADEPMEEEGEGEEVILFTPTGRRAAAALGAPVPAAAAAVHPPAPVPLPSQLPAPAPAPQAEVPPAQPQPPAPAPAGPSAMALAAAPPAVVAAAPAAAPAQEAAAAGVDAEMQEAAMEQTVHAVAGSVLPADDLQQVPVPDPLRQQPQLQPLDAVAVLPASFYSLFGTGMQPQVAQRQPAAPELAPAAAPAPAVAPAAATAPPVLQQLAALPQQAPPQQAAGLRALLFGGAARAAPSPPPLQQQLQQPPLVQQQQQQPYLGILQAAGLPQQQPVGPVPLHLSAHPAGPVPLPLPTPGAPAGGVSSAALQAPSAGQQGQAAPGAASNSLLAALGLPQLQAAAGSGPGGSSGAAEDSSSNKWGWMGAYAAPAGAAPQPGAASAPGAGPPQHQARQQPWTDNPFV
eukprot:scaffold12.g8231.t1